MGMTGQIKGRLRHAQFQLLTISPTKIPAIAPDEGVLGLTIQFSGIERKLRNNTYTATATQSHKEKECE